MAAIDISRVNNVVQVDFGNGTILNIADSTPCTYQFVDNDTVLLLEVDTNEYQIPYSNLTVSGAAPASPAAALSSLSSVFPSAGVGYKVYRALLTQSGTDAPVATVLENTLGGTVVWSYDDQGTFVGTLSNAFTEGKTATYPVGLTDDTISIVDKPVVLFTRSSENNVRLKTGLDGVASNGVLSNSTVQILVYP